MDSGGGGGSEICTSFMPKGSDHQQKYEGKTSREALVSQYLTQDLEYHQEGLQDEVQPQSERKDHKEDKRKPQEETNVTVETSESHKHLH